MKLKYLDIEILKWLLAKRGVRTIEREGAFSVIRYPQDRNLVLLVRHQDDWKWTLDYSRKWPWLKLIKKEIRGKWSLPGGGIKQKELAPEAASREALDETGFQIRILKTIAHLSLEIKYGFTVLFEAEMMGGQIKPDGNNEDIAECQFFHIHYLPTMYNAQRGMIGWSEYHKDSDPILFGHPNKPPISEFRT